MVMEKDGSGNSTGKDTELDALLSSADRGMLDAIRDSLDLDTGLAQILGDLAGVTPTGPAEAEPEGHARGYGHALDPVPACQVSGTARKIPAPAGPVTRTEPRRHRETLTTLAVAVMTALNIALLCGLSHGHWAAAAQPGTSANNLRPIAGEPARDLCYVHPPGPHQLIVLSSKAGAPTSLRSAADSAGIGGDPVIRYLKDSRSGPVFLLSGFPASAAIRFLSTGSTVSHRYRPFPSGGLQLSPGTTICITGGNGRVMLTTVQNQPGGQVGVIITGIPDLM